MELDNVPYSLVTSRQNSNSCNSESELQATVNKDDNECKETDWKLIWATGGVCFLAALESTASGMSEWPYMSTIDTAATSQFYGMSSSVYTAGHAIFAIVFSALYYKYHSVRLPLIIGRLLAFAGCIAYLCVEYLPRNRRYLMMTCYFIFGIATSSTAVLRMYIIEISTKQDRARAFAVVTVAELLSVIIGPIIQLCFSGIKYPGSEIFYNMKFHIYSAPIWIAAFVNLISIAVIAVVMKPVRRTSKRSTKDKNGLSYINMTCLRQKVHELRNSDVCWSLVLLCILQRFMSIPESSVTVIVGPFLMIAFEWERETSVIYSSIAMGIVGVISFAVAAIMMTPTVGRIPQRWMYLMSLSLPLVMYLLSYPYSATSHPITTYNATSGTGCNSAEYTWCKGAKAPPAFLFLPVIIVAMSLVIPLGAVSLDTIYSKIFGSLDQTFMQGAMVAVGDIVGILGPIYSTLIFTKWGQGTLWIVDSLLIITACVMWLIGFKKLKEYE